MNDIEEIKELYQTYWRCMIDKDIGGMDAIMTEDYELVHMTGKRQNKESFFASVRSGELNYYSAVHEEILPKVEGDHATLIGKSQVVAAVYGGGKNKWRLRGDFTLCKESDAWKLASSRASTY